MAQVVDRKQRETCLAAPEEVKRNGTRQAARRNGARTDEELGSERVLSQLLTTSQGMVPSDMITRILNCRPLRELRPILAALARTRKGETAIRETAANLLPKAKGRVKSVVEISEDIYLRQEFVPCGKPNCRKARDEHGPYWYSYRRINGQWKAQYQGRNRPSSEDFWTIEGAAKSIAEMRGLGTLDDNRAATLETIANAMASAAADSRAAALEREARLLLIEEQQRREDSLKARYDDLVSQKDAGRELSPDEIGELARISQVLSRDH